MASGIRLRKLQAHMGYEFADIDHLRQALTAADAVEENHDGNRRLAQLGDTMIQGVLVDKAYAEGASRSAASNFIKCTATKKHRAARATDLGIDACITYSPRQQDQPPSTTVLSLAVSAIVGASWIDCRRDFKVLRQVVEYLCIVTPEEVCVDPQELLFRRLNQITFLGETTESPVQPQTLNNDSFWESIVEREGSLSRALDQVQPESFIGNNSAVESLTTPAGESRDFSTQVSVLPNEASRNQTITIASVDGTVPDQANPLTQYQSSGIEANKLAVKRRKEAPITTEPKRKRPNNRRTQWFGFDEALLDRCISLEKTKCDNLRLACPERSYQSTETQDCIMTMGLDQYRIEVKTLFSAIASTESFEVLGTILQAYRRGPTDDSRKPGYSLSNARRLEAIESLDQNIANLGLLRRCHVLQLFRENCHCPEAATDGFVVVTTKGFSDRAKPKRGNPSYLANAEITKAIMNEVYPMLEESCAQYTERYRTVSYFRRLGKRLNILEMKFGYGILGLLPLGSQLNLSVTDSMIMSLPDESFEKFVVLLDRCRGQTLRQLSSPVESIVAKVFRGTLSHSASSVALDLEPVQILQKCKECPEVINLLVYASILPPQLLPTDAHR